MKLPITHQVNSLYAASVSVLKASIAMRRIVAAKRIAFYSQQTLKLTEALAGQLRQAHRKWSALTKTLRFRIADCDEVFQIADNCHTLGPVGLGKYDESSYLRILRAILELEVHWFPIESEISCSMNYLSVRDLQSDPYHDRMDPASASKVIKLHEQLVGHLENEKSILLRLIDEGRAPTTPATAHLELSKVAKSAFEIVRSSAVGLGGKAILKQLKSQGIKLEEATFRRHIVPELKLAGVVNNRKLGGYVYRPESP